MKRLVIAALLGVSALAGAEPASVRTVVRDAAAGVSQYLIALPHIAYGGGFRTKIVIRNTSSADADVSLYYFGAGGNPLGVPIGGVTSDHTIVTIPANGMSEVEPDWQGPDSSGWAALVYTSSGIKIQGVFLWHNPADPPDKYTEATAPVISQIATGCIIPLPPASSTMTMPYDQTEGRFSGYAFANTTSTPVTMTLTFYDQTGKTAGQYVQQLAGFEHTQILLSEKAASVANTKGTMQISGAGVVPLGFRFTQYYTFTTWLP